MKTFTLILALISVPAVWAATPTTLAPDVKVQTTTADKTAPGAVHADKTLLAHKIKPAEKMAACQSDVEKYCADVKPGEGQVLKCLKEHEAELTPNCRTQGEMLKDKFKAPQPDIREACKADFASTCKGVMGADKKLACLQAHESELATECKAALPAAKK